MLKALSTFKHIQPTCMLLLTNANFNTFLGTLCCVVLWTGAGTAVPTVRWEAKSLLHSDHHDHHQSPPTAFIRINPVDFQLTSSKTSHRGDSKGRDASTAMLAIPLNALVALEKIKEFMNSSSSTWRNWGRRRTQCNSYGQAASFNNYYIRQDPQSVVCGPLVCVCVCLWNKVFWLLYVFTPPCLYNEISTFELLLKVKNDVFFCWYFVCILSCLCLTCPKEEESPRQTNANNIQRSLKQTTNLCACYFHIIKNLMFYF